MVRRSKRGTVDAFVDAGFHPPDNWTVGSLAKAEVVRLRRMTLTGAIAMEMPRRIGHDVESFELAADKYLSKGITYIYWKLWGHMVSSKHALYPPEVFGVDDQHLYPPTSWRALYRQAVLDDETHRAGKTIIWTDWWKEARPRITARQRAIATFAATIDNYDWGYRMVNSMVNELKWIEMKFVTWHDRYYGEVA